MIDNTIDKYVEWQVNAGNFSQEDKNIYRYGIRVLFELLIIIVMAGIVCMMTGQLKNVLLISAAFIPLRIYSGGYHTKNMISCAFLTTFVLIVNIYLLKYNFLSDHILIWSVIYCFFSFYIMYIEPQDTAQKRLSSIQKRKYKKITIFFVIVYGIMYYTFVSYELYKYANMVFGVIVIQGINLLISVFLNERGK